MAFRQGFSAAVATIGLLLSGAAHAENHVSADTVVATVNGTDITLGHMIVLKQRLPEQYQQIPPDVLFEGILDQLVQQTLLGEQADGLSRGSQLVLDNESRSLLAGEEIQRVTENAVTDDSLEQAYDEAFAEMGAEPEYNASHILVETEDEAKTIITELESGADFATLAQEKSTGPSGPNGGELGWFGKGSMVEPFETAVVAMEPGTISAPVQTQFGWHVIRLNETRVKSAPPIEQVQAELADGLRRAAIEDRVKELTEGAEITRIEAGEIDPGTLNDISLITQ